MRLGIIADIHEHVELLRAALDDLKQREVDQVVFLGDLVETGERIEETCQLLADARVVGVWGNHDFGLCHEVSEEVRRTYSDLVLRFMGSLHPRLEIADCQFAHVEPWLDPTVIEDLWFFGGALTDATRLDQIFGAAKNRLVFAGHYHRWILASPDGIIDWHGETPIRLVDDRYFVVVNALFGGHYGVLDTDTSELTPCRVETP
jgi:3',5'-cyclic AMP phosphodiesterase CpdA